MLTAFAKSTPGAFIKRLPPQTAEYAGLMKAKMQLEETFARGGWGAKVPEGRTLRPGEAGPTIVALRNRMMQRRADTSGVVTEAQ